jgi:uncharacterized coiled-coil DUF342 family protein
MKYQEVMHDRPTNNEIFKWECRRKQIESLRVRWEGMGDMANAERALAALTIDNLMAEVEAWKKAMQKAERDMHELRKERDEARREVCEWAEHNLNEHPEHIARERGWDCYKEKPHA